MNGFATVAAAFRHSVENKPEALALRIIREGKEATELSNQALWKLCLQAAGAFQQSGLKAGDRLVLALGASPAFFAAYLGAWFSGVIPLVVSPVKKTGLNPADKERIGNWVERSGSSLLILTDPAGEFKVGARIMTATDLLSFAPIDPIDPQPNQTAHLQGTSGSTSSPKMAVVAHRHIAANVLGIGQAIAHRPSDHLLSWLPLSHDMGLIGLSYALGWQCPFTIAETACFIQNPMNWLQYISKYGATLSPAPNSAFQACARLARLRPPAAMDLSRWRVALCGSEPVQAATLDSFHETFSAYGYQPTTMLPVYGLAEATLAVSIPHPDCEPDCIWINRTALEKHGKAIAQKEDDAEPGIHFVALGRAIPGHEIRIGNHEALGEVGEVLVKGPSIIDAYWNNEAATAELKTEDGFLKTGDLGFMLDGQLYISGRIKDIIIIGGRNFLPQELEQTALDALAPWQVSTLAAVGIYDHKSGTEYLHLLVEERKVQDQEKRMEAETRLREALSSEQGISGIFIHWMGRGSLPHTTSGKIQRYLCRELIHQKPNPPIHAQ